jgi:hypothetical protein
VVTEQNIFNLGNAVAEAVMPKKGHMFFTNPEGLPAPEEKPDPKIEMQKEKAYMADKTKRDLAAVDLIKEVFMSKSGQNDAEATRQAQLMDKESENRANLESQMGERDFQREMKMMDMDHQKEMTFSTPEHKAAADQSTLINAMASLVDTVRQSQEVIANSQVQVAQSIENMNQALRAPKTVIRDKNGRAVGVKTENNNA